MDIIGKCVKHYDKQFGDGVTNYFVSYLKANLADESMRDLEKIVKHKDKLGVINSQLESIILERIKTFLPKISWQRFFLIASVCDFSHAKELEDHLL